jgi:cobalt/nickel transport protein
MEKSESLRAENSKGKSKKSWLINLVLVLAIIALAVLPLLLTSGANFSGTDDAASKAITEINPGFEQWIKPFWEPPGGEVETLLFCLQAAIGAGGIGYFFGLKQGEKRSLRKLQELQRNSASVADYPTQPL